MTTPKLTEAQKRELVNLHSEGISKAELGRMFNIHPRTVGRIIDAVGAKSIKPVEEKQPQAQETTENSQYGFLVLDGVLTVFKTTDDGVVSRESKKGNQSEELLKLLYASGFDQITLHNVWYKLDKGSFLTEVSNGNIKVNTQTGEVFYQNRTICGNLANRLIQESESSADFEKFCKFTEKVYANPSYRVVSEIYDFLQASDIDIDEDGDIIAFKIVNSEYKDIYTRTMDNSPGSTVSVERNMVNDDSSQTCSYGLHACSKAYLPHYGGYKTPNKIVRVKINPIDIVSIPMDYYGVEDGKVKAKLRCCSYFVLDDVTDKI